MAGTQTGSLSKLISQNPPKHVFILERMITGVSATHVERLPYAIDYNKRSAKGYQCLNSEKHTIPSRYT